MESECKEYEFGKYWINDKQKWHRENDLPAIENINGFTAWCLHGKYHREIGPAVIYNDPDDEYEERWYLDDVEYLPEEMPINLYINYLKWEYRKKNEK